MLMKCIFAEFSANALSRPETLGLTLQEKMRRILVFFFLGAFIFFSIPGSGDALQGDNPENPRDIHVIKLEGVVTAGQSAYIQRELQAIDPDNVQAVVIVMDTPGGLLDATLDLARAFGTAPVPIIVHVAPSGAIAASAGAFILVSSDIAAMAPGTTVGAAMPAAMSPGGAAEADEKIVNFFAGHMRSIAGEQGRPPEIAERFVTENLTLDAREAGEKDVIEVLAPNMSALLEELDGWEGEKHGEPYQLSTADATLVESEMTLQESFQDHISNPEIAFLLLMVGGMGIYLGLGMPGTFVAETLGAIALLLGIYGLGMFDTNLAGIIFIVLGFALLATEIFTGGFGILGVGGAVSLLIGSILLPQEPLMEMDWYGSFMATAIGIALAVSVISFLIVTVLIRSRRNWKEKGEFFRAAPTVEVVDNIAPYGTVKMRGEIWKAYSADGNTIPKGKTVEVIGQEGLTLKVSEAAEEDKEDKEDKDAKGEDN